MTPEPASQSDIRGSFSSAFRRWRRKRGIPLKRIALDLGISTSTVNAWELGERFPSAENFNKLIVYTGLPPCRLFCLMADRCVPNSCLLAMGFSPANPPRARRKRQRSR